MSAADINRSLTQAVAKAEREHLAAATAAFEKAIHGLGAGALVRFDGLTADATWQPPPEGLLITEAAVLAIERKLNQTLAPLRAAVVTDAAAAPLARVGISWDVSHPAAQGMIDSAAQRTGQRLGEAVQPVLRRTIADSYAQNLSVRDTSAAIRTAIDAAAPWQADMLARSDLNSLANGASVHAAQS